MYTAFIGTAALLLSMGFLPESMASRQHEALLGLEAAVTDAMIHCPNQCIACNEWGDNWGSVATPVHGTYLAPFSCGYSACPPDDQCHFSMNTRERAEFIVAAAEGMTAVLHDMMERFPEGIFLNVERQAIQLRGCGDDIIASFPVSTADIAILSDH